MRGAGAGGAGGAGGGSGGLTVRTGLTVFVARAGPDGLEAVRAEPRAGDDPEGRRRSVAPFFAIRAGLRAGVRDFVTRRDFAIGGILTIQSGPEGTVANRVVYGQDPKPKSISFWILGLLTPSLLWAQQPVQLIHWHLVAFSEDLECLPARLPSNFG